MKLLKMTNATALKVAGDTGVARVISGLDVDATNPE